LYIIIDRDIGIPVALTGGSRMVAGRQFYLERSAMMSPDNQILISALSVWEVTL
jgi:hypothetical protein